MKNGEQELLEKTCTNLSNVTVRYKKEVLEAILCLSLSLDIVISASCCLGTHRGDVGHSESAEKLEAGEGRGGHGSGSEGTWHRPEKVEKETAGAFVESLIP